MNKHFLLSGVKLLAFIPEDYIFISLRIIAFFTAGDNVRNIGYAILRYRDYMVYAFVIFATINTLAIKLNNTFPKLFNGKASAICAYFSSSCSDIFRPNAFKFFITFFSIFSAIFSCAFLVFEAIFSMVIRIVIGIESYIFSRIGIITLFAIRIYARWARSILMKFRQRKYLITLWTKFCIHKYIISEISEKYNEATRLGWRVYRYTGKAITSGQAVREIERYLQEDK